MTKYFHTLIIFVQIILFINKNCKYALCKIVYLEVMNSSARTEVAEQKSYRNTVTQSFLIRVAHKYKEISLLKKQEAIIDEYIFPFFSILFKNHEVCDLRFISVKYALIVLYFVIKNLLHTYSYDIIKSILIYNV